MALHALCSASADECIKWRIANNWGEILHMSRNFGKMLPAPYRQWKLTVLFFLLLLVFASLEAGGVDSEQIEALKTIATGSPLGSLWNELRSDPCSGKWPGVGCSDSQNAIIELNLPGQKLVGNLSVEFFKLTDLRRLNLSFNFLQGPVSDQFEQMTDLVSLDLSFNSLSGQIPMKLRDLKHLEILNLAGNNLQGFPQDLLTLPKLRTLSLAHNPLGTFIPPFLKASLQSLVLQNCSLSGVIPDLRPLENLVTLFLGYNNLSGRVSDSFADLKSLELLALNDNPLLAGNLPTIPNPKLVLFPQNNITASVSPSTWNNSYCTYLRDISCKGIPTYTNTEDCSGNRTAPWCVQPKKGKKDQTKMVVAIVGGCSVGTLLLGTLLICFIRRSNNKNAKLKKKRSDLFTPVRVTQSGAVQPSSSCDVSSQLISVRPEQAEVTSLISPHPVQNRSLMKLTYSEILEATESFRADYLLGSGGSGHVYKGFIRGQVCAFKVLKPSSEDKSREKEFHAELSILGRMSHPNLIRLVGYCQDRSHRALVYEYLRNGSLDDQLHGLNRVHLSWHQRLTILLGATRAIDYLHMGGGGKFSPVIHRDLKTSNILIDDQLRAKVSDLGFAKLIPRDKSLATTTGVLGTIGYLAPEYFHTGQLSRKSDMYCLGVVILEAMTGRRPVEVIQMPRSQMHLVYWARLQLRDRKKVVALLDAMFADGAYCEKSVCKVAAVTAKCLAEEPDLRPTAAEVLAELEAAHQLSSQFQSKLVWGGKK